MKTSPVYVRKIIRFTWVMHTFKINPCLSYNDNVTNVKINVNCLTSAPKHNLHVLARVSLFSPKYNLTIIA